jgi:hypothetical protein
MKAERYGTLAEQCRYQAEWMPAKQRTDDRIRKCINCGNSEIPTNEDGVISRTGLRCAMFGFATRDGAICKFYRSR